MKALPLAYQFAARVHPLTGGFILMLQRETGSAADNYHLRCSGRITPVCRRERSIGCRVSS